MKEQVMEKLDICIDLKNPTPTVGSSDAHMSGRKLQSRITELDEEHEDLTHKTSSEINQSKSHMYEKGSKGSSRLKPRCSVDTIHNATAISGNRTVARAVSDAELERQVSLKELMHDDLLPMQMKSALPEGSQSRNLQVQ